MASNTDEQDVRQPARGIFDALEAAQKAINQYDYQRLYVASQGHPPDEHEDVIEKHVQMHTTVMNLWRRTRALVAKEYPEYWERAKIYQDPPHVDFEDAEKQIKGLAGLAFFQGNTRSWEEKVEDRHGAPKIVRKAEPVLLPPRACRRSVLTIGEMVVEAGWLRPAEEREAVAILDERRDDSADVMEADD